MKTIIFSILAFTFLSLNSCGGGNKDAKAFCDCVKNETKECGENMEALEDEFKKDPKRFEAFKEAAKKECPDFAKDIDRMD